MLKSNATNRVQIAVRIALAAIFLYAATMKALHGDGGNVPSTMFADWARSNFVRDLIVGAEIALAAWLLAGVRVGLAGILAVAILSAFTGLLIFEFKAEHPKPCGCMGTALIVADSGAIRASLRFDLVRNIFMMGGAGWLYTSAKTRGRAVALAGQSSPPAAARETIHSIIA
jgi:uncharacterized membrane protein YphA (DoxX/SURF4 family)